LRAFGAREPDPSVRNPDTLAERMISRSELQLITEHPISKALQEDYRKGRKSREVAEMSNLMLIRMIWMFLTRRSKWYALAFLTV
jgi:hypothetical protein